MKIRDVRRILDREDSERKISKILKTFVLITTIVTTILATILDFDLDGIQFALYWVINIGICALFTLILIFYIHRMSISSIKGPYTVYKSLEEFIINQDGKKYTRKRIISFRFNENTSVYSFSAPRGDRIISKDARYNGNKLKINEFLKDGEFRWEVQLENTFTKDQIFENLEITWEAEKFSPEEIEIVEGTIYPNQNDTKVNIKSSRKISPTSIKYYIRYGENQKPIKKDESELTCDMKMNYCGCDLISLDFSKHFSKYLPLRYKIVFYFVNC